MSWEYLEILKVYGSFYRCSYLAVFRCWIDVESCFKVAELIKSRFKKKICAPRKKKTTNKDAKLYESIQRLSDFVPFKYFIT